jgi:twitching motility two-component system response regulator PilG
VVALNDLNALLENAEVDRSRLEAAISRYGRQLEQNSFEVHYNLALAFLNLGRIEEGLQQLRSAGKLQPHNKVLGALAFVLSQRLTTSAPGTAPASPRATVLVVDDSATQRQFVKQVLDQHGYTVITANDGEEALQKLANPDVVLLDINMPKLDGYQVCKTIRENSATAHLPVIMLSGKDGFFDKVRGRMVGSTDYITKPCEPAVLLATIEKYLTVNYCTRE